MPRLGRTDQVTLSEANGLHDVLTDSGNRSSKEFEESATFFFLDVNHAKPLVGSRLPEKYSFVWSF